MKTKKNDRDPSRIYLFITSYFAGMQNRFRFNMVNAFGLLSIQQQHKYERSRLQTIHTAKLFVMFEKIIL